MNELPLVSVVIPMLDERGHISDCLDAFAGQTYPTSRLELLVVDGGSTDGSRELVEKRAIDEPWIRLVDNPARRASAAFNRGVEAASGEIVCLFSAHGVPARTYVEASVRILRETLAAGVGGRYHHEGMDRASNAIGRAMTSPFGMASPHRVALARTEVDTISHPAYLRAALLDTGPFDETLLRNSDYELNYRMRLRGHRLIFDPSIESVYRPRPSLEALAHQFWHYGRWKARVARQHPGSVRPRHLVAPAAVAGVLLSPLLILTRPGRWVCGLGVAGYVLGTAAAVAQARPLEHDADPLVLAASFPVMHGAWGAGFLASMAEDAMHWSST
jgi:glycosyltransferase involved in cell wall biosynthesis